VSNTLDSLLANNDFNPLVRAAFVNLPFQSNFQKQFETKFSFSFKKTSISNYILRVFAAFRSRRSNLNQMMEYTLLWQFKGEHIYFIYKIK